jgi:hypothetical protein
MAVVAQTAIGAFKYVGGSVCVELTGYLGFVFQG